VSEAKALGKGVLIQTLPGATRSVTNRPNGWDFRK
jgi:hypothetical protein